MDNNYNMSNNYNQPYYNNVPPQPPYNNMELERPCSLGDWMITLFITFIPVLGFIMLLVWAFGGGSSKSKANWAKATLIWMIIGIILSILFYSLIGALIMGAATRHY
ncbi:MAG: hypothetical protein J6M92_10095 [Oribacterium sp.]|nr:hypothetical protein [Oribacterium sp.]